MPVCKPCLIFVWCCFFFSPGALFAQNLVANPGFSDINICIEYKAPCEPAAWWRVAPSIAKPLPIYNPNGSANGENYIQVESSPVLHRTRNYMQTRLLAPLQAGKSYKVTVYAGSRNDAADGIDLLFVNDYVYSIYAGALDSVASVSLRKQQEVKQYRDQGEKWHVYEQVYTPSTTYSHLVIGDFSAQLPAKGVVASNFLYIDSVAIVPVGFKEILGPKAKAISQELYAEKHRHTLPLEFLQASGIDLMKMLSPAVDIPDSVKRQRMAEYFRLLENSHSLPPATVQQKLLELIKLQQGSSHCDTVILREGLFLDSGPGINTNYGFVIDSAVKLYGPGQSGKIRIVGYMDRPGTDKYNEVLSLDRANSVARYLVYRAGFSYDDLEMKGLGRQSPRYDSTTAEGRRENNRVEMIFCVPPQPITIAPPTPPKNDTLIVPDVLFKHNSAELEPQFVTELDKLTAKIPKENIQLQIIGHTDSNGTDAYNNDLSRRRAVTVAAFLSRKGYQDKVRFVSGEGERRPVAGNATPEGRQQNRRVEIIIYKGLN